MAPVPGTASAAGPGADAVLAAGGDARGGGRGRRRKRPGEPADHAGGPRPGRRTECGRAGPVAPTGAGGVGPILEGSRTDVEERWGATPPRDGGRQDAVAGLFVEEPGSGR